MSATTGWVVASWSCRYAQDFSELENVVQAVRQRVASAWQRVEAYSANDSFSQRSSHQRIVTRSPNHMWASSCRIVRPRRSTIASGTFERQTYCSVIVTVPAFSIAPALNSGTNSWSYLAKG